MISDVPYVWFEAYGSEITFRSWLAQMMMKKLIAYLNDYLKVALLQCHYLKLFGPNVSFPKRSVFFGIHWMFNYYEED